MKVVIALCLIVLFSQSLAKKSKFEESKYVSALKGLFQIASADEFDEVRDILELVRNQIEGLLDSTVEAYENAADVHEAEHDAAVDALNSYANSIEELETGVEEAEEVIERLQESIDSSLAAIDEASASQSAEEARRVTFHDSFREVYDNLGSAIADVEDALRLLQEIDTQDLSGSFLEINNKKISHKFDSLHKVIHHLKLNHLTPVTKMLVEIADDGLNHDVIGAIIQLVTQLLDDLKAELDFRVGEDNADDETSRATLANLQATIDNQKQSAETSQTELNDYTAKIEWSNEQLELLTSAFERDQDLLKFNEEAWSSTAENYEALIRRLKRDIEAVEAAQTFVDRD